MKRITIDPITRLEGHGRILLFLDEEGALKDAVLEVPELRGFERFCRGRRGEEMPQITERICGVCPEAHHLASAKCLDDCYRAEVPQPARLQRELFYNVYIFSDHLLHLVFLGGPDLLLPEDVPKGKRNVLGVLEAHPELGREVVRVRARAQKILDLIGGKAIHPVFALPGGVARPLSEEGRDEIRGYVQDMVKLAEKMVAFFHEQVLPDPGIQSLLLSEDCSLPTHYMGLVDEGGAPNFYDGRLRVVSATGEELFCGDAREGLSLIEEHAEPWTYVKFPYLKEVGWKGFSAGPDSGIYRVGPLARINVAERMATPLAQEELERFLDHFEERPVHATFAYHWARLIEMVQAAEAAQKLVEEDALTGAEVRGELSRPGEGVGVIEAARGTLFHHYRLDSEGLVVRVNLIVATTHNAAGISLSVKQMAARVVREGELDDRLLNRVEMAFRAYDPCLACATHFLPGETPLVVEIYDAEGKLKKRVLR
ncbi:MAG: Methyl-viologen-reducing hydrogenase subunit A [Acetothermia bacterium 64_32]|nr:MAG: Methyl-viologen-reducing hydrogenase subunit A [Acetothermia bacterium 64_32]HAF70548.1 Ni/Fe hydrogenase subunit alpha [Candidatus Acetothermia bacterium]